MGFYSRNSGYVGYANNTPVGKTKVSNTGLISIPASLLLKTNGSSLVDSGVNVFTPTLVGNTAVSSADFYISPTSLYFDGAGDYVTVPDNGAWDFTGQFTVELTIKFTGRSGIGQAIISNWRWSVGTNTGWTLSATPDTGKLGFGANDGSLWNGIPFNLTGTTTVLMNTWYHVALTRDSSNVVRMFLNGSLEASGTLSFNPINNQGDPLRIGAQFGDGEGNSPFMGYIDEVRIFNGQALYTSNFTAPTQTLDSSITADSITLVSTYGTGVITLSEKELELEYNSVPGLAGKFFNNSNWRATIASGNIGTLPLTTTNDSSNVTGTGGLPSAAHRYGVNRYDYITYNSIGDSYGFIAVGYFKPPTTGSYTFYTSSDDGSGLWIGQLAVTPFGRTSTNATVNNGLGAGQGNTKRSASIFLYAGVWYPIRIVHEEGNGGDNLTFSWSGPGIAETTDLSVYFRTPANGDTLIGHYV
jgi:hypothetical protein